MFDIIRLWHIAEFRALRKAIIIGAAVGVGTILLGAFIGAWSFGAKAVILELGMLAIACVIFWLATQRFVIGTEIGAAVVGLRATVPPQQTGAQTQPAQPTVPSAIVEGGIAYVRLVSAVLASELAIELIALWLPLHNNPVMAGLLLPIAFIFMTHAIWQQAPNAWPRVVRGFAVVSLATAIVMIVFPQTTQWLASQGDLDKSLLDIVSGITSLSLLTTFWLAAAIIVAALCAGALIRQPTIKWLVQIGIPLIAFPLLLQALMIQTPTLQVALQERSRAWKETAVQTADPTMPSTELAQRLVAALKESGTRASEDAVKKITNIEKAAKEKNRPLTPAEITEMFEEYKVGAGIKQTTDEHIEEFRKAHPKLFPKEAPKPSTPPHQQSTRAPAPVHQQALGQGGEWTGPGETVYVAKRGLEWGKQRKIKIPPFGYRFEASFESKERCGLDALLNEATVVQSAHTELNMNRHVPQGRGIDSIRYRPVDCEMVILRVKVYYPGSNPILSQ